jgi:hypothetical protein
MMLVSVFSAKGSPGVTSSALALAAVWPRPVVLIEADPTGGDLVYRCRSADGSPLAATPNLLGLVSAARSSFSTPLTGWSQRLGCGVNLVSGVTAPSQTRGMVELWPALITAVHASEVDVIADVGRLRRESSSMPLVESAAVRVPVLAASVESVVHTRELLKDVSFDPSGRSVPLLIGRSRSAEADCRDVDGVMAEAGLMLAPTLSVPLDRPGVDSLHAGGRIAGRLRASHLVRAARTATATLLELAGAGVSR